VAFGRHRRQDFGGRTDPTWSRKLLEMAPGMRHGYVAGVNSIVQNPAAKRELRASTGAVAVDMESHLVARAAATHGLAFAAVRVIVDPAHRAVPDSALMAARFRGSACLTALMRELMVRPSEISALVRIAFDSYAARSTLLRLRRDLGPRFGFSERGELRCDLRQSNTIGAMTSSLAPTSDAGQSCAHAIARMRARPRGRSNLA